VPAYVEEGLEGEPAGEGRWTVRDGAAAIATRGRTAALALAPTPALAERLAERSPSG
jgi:hypothetical protein